MAAVSTREVRRIEQLLDRSQSHEGPATGISPAWTLASVRDLTRRMALAKIELQALHGKAELAAADAAGHVAAWQVRVEKTEAAISSTPRPQGDEQ